MSRDFAKKYPPSKRRVHNYPATLMIVGVIVLLVASFVSSAIYFERHHIAKAVSTAVKPVKKVAARNKKKTDVRSTAPTFDFYSILSDADSQVSVNNFARSATSNLHGNGYILQVASVRDATAAQQLKSELALLGFTTLIQKIQSHGVVWNRVSVGPYTSHDAAKADQDRLKRHKISSLLLTLKLK